MLRRRAYFLRGFVLVQGEQANPENHIARRRSPELSEAARSDLLQRPDRARELVSPPMGHKEVHLNALGVEELRVAAREARGPRNASCL